MSSMNVSLPDKMKEWVDDQIGSGQFGNASEYVRHLIRRDQREADKLRKLRALIQEGIDSGVSPSSVDDVVAKVLAEVRR